MNHITNTNITNGTDMLTVFDSIQVNNDEKISFADKQFCEHQQQLLDTSLDQIDKWYGFFREEAEHYKESHRITFQENGTVKTNPPYTPASNYPVDYRDFEFEPFDILNKLVEQRKRAIIRFGNTIISYFNRTYSLSVSNESPDRETIPVTLRPTYLSFVDQVIEHLGGKNFRETAEEEIIGRFHDKVLSLYNKMPELKGNKIVFYDVLRFDDLYLKKYNRAKIEYSYDYKIETLCEGIAFAGNDSLNGSTRIISSFNSDYVNTTDPYSIFAGDAQKMKFYKNGRIDVLFSSTATAGSAFKKLRLDNINQSGM